MHDTHAELADGRMDHNVASDLGNRRRERVGRGLRKTTSRGQLTDHLSGHRDVGLFADRRADATTVERRDGVLETLGVRVDAVKAGPSSIV